MDNQPDFSTQPFLQWKFLGPPQEAGEIGRLAQYRVLRQLGQGGMGIVFQAEDEHLRRPAALKVMRPDFAEQQDARERFGREARAAAHLKHDNIVTIYQVGEHNGVPFLAMEFLAGKSLEEWLRPDRRATVAETLTLGKQIARGLAAAHKAGLVHRDIKPANLWLEAPRGRVKILDFGLARSTAGEFTALTHDGAVIGTPAYMAPEQARGEIVDQRGDLFSFGCVLYRMVTGRVPFQGHTLYAVLAAIATETPPAVRDLNPEVPPRLAGLIERLLAKAPADRPESAQAVFDELVQIEKELKSPGGVTGMAGLAQRYPVGDEPLTGATRRPWWWFVALGVPAVLLLGGLALGLSGVLSGGKKDSPNAQPVPAPPDRRRPAIAAPVNVLELVKPARDKRRGFWTLNNGHLRGRPQIEDGKVSLVLALPWQPPRAYHLRLTVRRMTDAPGHLGLGLACDAARFNFLFDNPKEDKVYSGIPMVDGVHLSQLPETRIGPVLPYGIPTQITCTVQPNQVRAEANGQQIYRWNGDMSKLGRPAIQTSRPLMLFGSQQGDFLFDEIVLESLGPDPGRPYGE